jgi:integrase
METKFTFTKRKLESLPVPKAKRATYHDSEVRGLGLLVQPTSGHRAFFWYRKVHGFPTFRKIGDFPDLTVEQARGTASGYNARLAKGENPFSERTHETIERVFEDYIARHLQAHSKNPERAAKAARWHINRFLPSWKARNLASIRREDIRALHAAIGEKYGHYNANRVLQLLKAVFNWARREELTDGENPARGIQLFHESARIRFAQPTEFPKLFAELRREQNLDLRDFVILALFTGARRGNLLAMRWDQLDLQRGLWTIPDPKNREPHTVALIAEAVAVLRSRRRRIMDRPWVFPGQGRTGHLVEIKHGWIVFRERAQLGDLRIHDLRRTLGSWQAGTGASLPIIGKSLGHRSVGATQVYSRLILDPVRKSVEQATRAMLTAGKTSRQRLLATRRERKRLKA